MPDILVHPDCYDCSKQPHPLTCARKLHTGSSRYPDTPEDCAELAGIYCIERGLTAGVSAFQAFQHTRGVEAARA